MDETPKQSGLPTEPLPTTEESIVSPQGEAGTTEPIMAPFPEDLSPTSPQNVDNVPSDTVSEPETIVSDCDYCQNKEKYQMVIDTYVEKSAAKVGDKVSIPFVEEVALLLNKPEETLGQWLLDPIHTEWVASVNKLVLIQKLRLLQRASGRFTPTGAIFLLEKLHGL
jgi:hypothetical protein